MSGGDPVRVLLVDDHAVVRAGDIDPMVMDLAMPGQGGLSAVQRITARERAPRVLVFTMHAHPSFAEQAFAAGALGYVTKSSPPAALLEALASVARGKRYLSADIAAVLHLSVKTVRNLHYAVKRKLEVRDDIELVRLALRLEVVDLMDFAAIAPPSS